MITIATFGDLAQRGYAMYGHCPSCGRDKPIDVTKFDPARRFVGARFKCTDCGAQVSITISPPNTLTPGDTYGKV